MRAGVFLCALLVTSVASAGTITGPGRLGPVKAKGLTAAEGKAIEIASVRVTGVEGVGVFVTATFRGNIEQMLGRGHLTTGLVALILRPKDASFKTADLATTGAGAIGQTLAKTHSTDVGVLRDARRITFFIGGPGFGNVGKVQVKAFAAAPAPGSRSTQGSGVTPEKWEAIETDVAADEALLTAPSPDTSCTELKTMGAAVEALESRAVVRDRQLRDLSDRLKKAVSQLEQHPDTSTVGKAIATASPQGAVNRLLGMPTDLDRVQKARDLLRSLRLDVRLADAYIEKNAELRRNIAKLLGQVEGMIAAKCGASGGTTPPVGTQPKLTPIHAAFDPADFRTVYSEGASGDGRLQYQWSVSIPPRSAMRAGFHAQLSATEPGDLAPRGRQPWRSRATTRGRLSGPVGTPERSRSSSRARTGAAPPHTRGTQGDNGAPEGDGDPPKPCVPR